jgi:hypothetical protein
MTDKTVELQRNLQITHDWLEGRGLEFYAAVVAAASSALTRQAQVSDDAAVEPFAYAYRYPSFPPAGATVIRFGTNGREINGSKPIEAIPLYTAPPAATNSEAVSKLVEALEQVTWLCPKVNVTRSPHNQQVVKQIEQLARDALAKLGSRAPSQENKNG